MIFTNSHLEKNMYRAWLRDGQSLEISWRTRLEAGFGILIHGGDTGGRRILWLSIPLVQIFFPLGIIRKEFEVLDEPQWSFSLSREFGIVFRWGQWRKALQWPFHTICLEHACEGKDSEWYPWKPGQGREHLKTETHKYTYVLKSGIVQNRTATILKERWILGRHILSRLGLWPRRISYSIDIWFSDEVGERSGSWKGGCLGCSYSMLPGETPLDALRRMERERKF